MRFRVRGSIALFSALFFLPSLPCPGTSAPLLAEQPKPTQKLDAMNLERAHAILRQTYDEVRRSYYDPSFHGVDIDGSYRQYDARLNSSPTINDSFRVIAAFLLSLHDSHTFFQPPMRANPSTLGYEMEMVGEDCLITQVRPGTDAATKLHVGDQVLALNGFRIQRREFSNMRYYFETLSPAPTATLDLQSPTGERRQETIKALLRPGKVLLDATGGDGGGDFWQMVREDEESDHLNRERSVEKGDTLIWRMPSFNVEQMAVDKMFGQVRKHSTLVLDLRGNRGGSVEILRDMLGYVFEHDVKLADQVSRKDTKPLMVKGKGGMAFTGKLIVLVDSESASAAELFARVVQLEHRGQVIGDVSGGAVMEARDFTQSVGTDTRVFYGVSVTSANLVMTDGKSLENVGVIPDVKMLPTAADLAGGKDPALAQAAKLAGLTMMPEEAGKLFPFEWPSL
jgi:C-terminal processing protease CtpA/Prc